MQNNTKIVQTDPLYNEVPELGLEGLISTIDDETKLLQALEKEIKKRIRILLKWQASN